MTKIVVSLTQKSSCYLALLLQSTCGYLLGKCSTGFTLCSRIIHSLSLPSWVVLIVNTFTLSLQDKTLWYVRIRIRDLWLIWSEDLTAIQVFQCWKYVVMTFGVVAQRCKFIERTQLQLIVSKRFACPLLTWHLLYLYVLVHVSQLLSPRHVNASDDGVTQPP